MSKEAFDKIMDGLDDALAYAKGDVSRGAAHTIQVPVPDVKAIRGKLGMTQPDFARAFRVSLGTVRNWEQGRRRPEGPALTLLGVIEKEPNAVLRAIKAG
jgi:putative transcriptional regulator